MNLGGAFIFNKDRFALVMSYVLYSCDGACHCYVYPNWLLFYPANEQKRGNITIYTEFANPERLEEVFEVIFNYCGNAFNMFRYHGWLISIYRWEKV